MNIQLLQGDCLEIMPTLPDASIDLICCDLPYGVTSCKWDTVIPFEPLWAQYKRLIKPRGAVVLFGSQPFTTLLIMSNMAWFKYCWVWDKAQSGSFQNAKYGPLRITEDVVVFGDKAIGYNPIMRYGKMRKRGGSKRGKMEVATGLNTAYEVWSDTYYPTNILRFPNCVNRETNEHPTQKPVALLEYLILTYSNPGDTVMDNTMGSGSTGVACINTGRDFIGIEKDETYFAVASARIEKAQRQPVQMEMAL